MPIKILYPSSLSLDDAQLFKMAHSKALDSLIHCFWFFYIRSFHFALQRTIFIFLIYCASAHDSTTWKFPFLYFYCWLIIRDLSQVTCTKSSKPFFFLFSPYSQNTESQHLSLVCLSIFFHLTERFQRQECFPSDLNTCYCLVDTDSTEHKNLSTLRSVIKNSCIWRY